MTGFQLQAPFRILSERQALLLAPPAATWDDQGMVSEAYAFQLPGWLCLAAGVTALVIAAVVYWLMRPASDQH
jgi:hypothetical protein